MMSIRDLLAHAGDIPEGIKDILRQRKLGEDGPDREDIEDGLMDFTFTPEDGIDIDFTFDPEYDDGE